MVTIQQSRVANARGCRVFGIGVGKGSAFADLPIPTQSGYATQFSRTVVRHAAIGRDVDHAMAPIVQRSALTSVSRLPGSGNRAEEIDVFLGGRFPRDRVHQHIGRVVSSVHALADEEVISLPIRSLETGPTRSGQDSCGSETACGGGILESDL